MADISQGAWGARLVRGRGNTAATPGICNIWPCPPAQNNDKSNDKRYWPGGDQLTGTHGPPSRQAASMRGPLVDQTWSASMKAPQMHNTCAQRRVSHSGGTGNNSLFLCVICVFGQAEARRQCSSAADIRTSRLSSGGSGTANAAEQQNISTNSLN